MKLFSGFVVVLFVAAVSCDEGTIEEFIESLSELEWDKTSEQESVERNEPNNPFDDQHTPFTVLDDVSSFTSEFEKTTEKPPTDDDQQVQDILIKFMKIAFPDLFYNEPQKSDESSAKDLEKTTKKPPTIDSVVELITSTVKELEKTTEKPPTEAKLPTSTIDEEKVKEILAKLLKSVLEQQDQQTTFKPQQERVTESSFDDWANVTTTAAPFHHKHKHTIMIVGIVLACIIGLVALFALIRYCCNANTRYSRVY